MGARKGGRVYTKDKETNIYSKDACGFLYSKGAIVTEALVPFGQARPVQGGWDRSGGVE